MAKKLGGLGRGFYDIYDDNTFEKGTGQTLRISDIEPRRDQPRKTFERESLEVLADSIAVFCPIRKVTSRWPCCPFPGFGRFYCRLRRASAYNRTRKRKNTRLL